MIKARVVVIGLRERKDFRISLARALAFEAIIAQWGLYFKFECTFIPKSTTDVHGAIIVAV